MEIEQHYIRNEINNKETIRSLCDNLKNGRELFQYLETTDFFTAPASTKYHLALEGGLAQHTLNVYNNICNLLGNYGLQDINQSALKVSLCHDLYKIGMYELYSKNEKINGQWIQTPAYKVKDSRERYIVGSGGITSYMIASRYLEFTDEEIAALCNYDKVVNQKDNMEVQDVINTYPLTLLLHMADMGAMYITEHE